MPLTLRKRGDNWYARGAIRIGSETVKVGEFCTGTGSRKDAEAIIAAETHRITQERLAGPAGRTKRLTLADCFETYLDRPGGVKAYDRARIAAFNEAMGGQSVSDVADVWRTWVARHSNQAPATLQRSRNTLLAALNAGCEARGMPAPPVPSVKVPRDERVPYLTPKERATLLRSYNPHAACPVLLLAFQGLRSQEALRLDWRQVDLIRETLHIRAEGTKTRRGRTVPMHHRVALLLRGMWHAAGCPAQGVVFLSSRGVPYADTRSTDEDEGQGGNPLRQAHATACAAAGVEGFRVHDWRHDWAARMVMGGVDLYTLMRLGGWSSLRMVERYAAVTADHMRDAMRKIA